MIADRPRMLRAPEGSSGPATNPVPLSEQLRLKRRLLQFDRALKGAHLIGIGRRVLRMEVLNHADAQSLDAALKTGETIAGGLPRAGRIVRIVAGNRMEQDGVVFHGARHWPDVVERIGQRKHPAKADRAVGWLHADNAAACRGIAHRTAGVSAERRRCKARRQRRARAA